MSAEKKKKVRKIPRNPNKRPCVASNISFAVQRENEKLLRRWGRL
jgi:hypothetical protein